MQPYQSNLDQLQQLPCLMEPVSNGKQWGAIFEFLKSIEQLSGPYESQRETVANQIKNINPNMITLQSAMRISIALFEYAILDEIRPDNYNKELIRANYSWADNASIYHRFYVYKGIIPQKYIDLIKEVNGPFKSFIIGSVEHISQHYEGSGTLGRLTPKLGYWLDANVIPLPPICVHRSTLFMLSLLGGFNPLKGHTVNRQKKPKYKTEPRYIRRNRALLRLRLLSTNRILSLKDRSISCWQTLLSEGTKKETECATILFSSGTSANETAIHYVASRIQNNAYVHPYWYFENINSIKKSFDTQNDGIGSLTRAAFVNLEPATTHSYLPEATVVSPSSVIKRLFQSALKNPKKTFWLVVDVTMDPLFTLTEVTGTEAPPNLVIIKTLSVTKHQFGCRNYFFGVITLSASAKLVRDAYTTLRTLRPKFGGCLQEGHYMSFPRQTRTRIQKVQERIKFLSFKLTEWIPKNLSWQIIDKTYVAFLIPPVQPISEIGEFLFRRKKELGDKEFKNQYRYLNEMHHQLITSLLQPDHFQRFPNIELGNSFGLSTTRVLYDQGTIMFNQNRLGMGTVRIAPGFDTWESELKGYFIEMVDQFARCMRQMAPLLGCKQHLDLIYPGEKIL
ncbi:hypothetical protein N8703_04085 [Verrucomicrobia bacterium]|nr:hypothetical protein [Verrucomicrobiota bacterium]